MRTSSRDRAPHTAPRPDPTAPADTTGPGAPEPVPAPPGTAYDDAHLDGLFTYCLSILGEHDAATAALGEALALAERQDERGRRPTAPALLRPWLYALARWSCLRRLSARRGTTADTRPEAPHVVGDDTEARRRRRELAALSWPEAAGTTQPQHEALELTVRHQLPVRDVARVLRLSESAAHTLVTTGAREVERTRAALAALESAGCPATAALAGDDRRLLLGSGMRRELIRHVDDCPACRLVAQRAMAAVSWPGGRPAAQTRLAILPAPRAAVEAARLAILRARAQHTPRYDRAGFPVDEKERAARREKLRGRALTTAVVAAVVAAPVLALWAAYEEGAPTGERARGEDAAATAQDGVLTGSGGGGELRYGGVGGGGTVEDGAAGDGRDRTGGDDGAAAQEGDDPSAEPDTGQDAADSEGTAGEGDAGPGRITAEAAPTGAGTRITLTASGGEPVAWTLTADADWLLPSRTSGTLRPGESEVVEVTVDPAREPAGPWRARITVEPAAAVITVEGGGAPEPGPSPSQPQPTEPEDPAEPTPTGTASPDPEPDPA
ncbi:hypothetical protein [Streptomyces sp. NPDC049881]|uniref:BACON domain-containing protein n=1 Tax=Streptomyces sp. NPDC049881 TaxID=3155778 RepID=UPI003442B411